MTTVAHGWCKHTGCPVSRPIPICSSAASHLSPIPFPVKHSVQEFGWEWRPSCSVTCCSANLSHGIPLSPALGVLQLDYLNEFFRCILRFPTPEMSASCNLLTPGISIKLMKNLITKINQTWLLTTSYSSREAFSDLLCFLASAFWTL